MRRILVLVAIAIAMMPPTVLANHRYMSTGNTVQSAYSGKANWDPTDAVTIAGSLRANGGTNCGNAGPLASLSSFTVKLFPATGSGIAGAQHRCGGDEFTVSPGTDASGNFSFSMSGGGVSWTSGSGDTNLGCRVEMQFTVNSNASNMVCGDSSIYSALGGACSSAPGIYGVMASPDLNGDGSVDASDLPLLADYLGDNITVNWAWQMDYNHDGYADTSDVSYWAGRSSPNSCSLSKAGDDYAMNVHALANETVLAFLLEHGMTASDVIADWNEMELSYDHEAAATILSAPVPRTPVQNVGWGRVKALYRD